MQISCRYHYFNEKNDAHMKFIDILVLVKIIIKEVYTESLPAQMSYLQQSVHNSDLKVVNQNSVHKQIFRNLFKHYEIKRRWCKMSFLQNSAPVSLRIICSNRFTKSQKQIMYLLLEDSVYLILGCNGPPSSMQLFTTWRSPPKYTSAGVPS